MPPSTGGYTNYVVNEFNRFGLRGWDLRTARPMVVEPPARALPINRPGGRFRVHARSLEMKSRERSPVSISPIAARNTCGAAVRVYWTGITNVPCNTDVSQWR